MATTCVRHPAAATGRLHAPPLSRQQSNSQADTRDSASESLQWVNEVDGLTHAPRTMAKGKIPPDLQAWIDARKRHRLSHAQVQMARELGLNPKKLGKVDNHRQEPWKAPLPAFIEDLYRRRFKRDAPASVRSIEDTFKAAAAKKAGKARAKALRRDQEAASGHEPAPPPAGERT
jgi:hypothetical protein